MTNSGYIYTASKGESFDSIALRLYGNEKYAADLLKMNPQYGHKMTMSGGEQLKLPAVQITTDAEGREMSDTTAPWKR